MTPWLEHAGQVHVLNGIRYYIGTGLISVVGVSFTIIP
jgi:hypothetical protein